MPNPRVDRPGRIHLHRDNQQWVFDYLIQQTGRTYHWWTEGDPMLPPEVRSHAMASKHLGKRGLAKELAAQAEREAGRPADAFATYWAATRDLMKAQHHVFAVNDEKRFLYDAMRRCFDMVRELCPYEIERIEVPWEGATVTGWLHLCPGLGRGPLVFCMPGCDVTCEFFPNPMGNPGHRRGFHIFSFDGPGLGQSNMSGVSLTADNFERAASAALDALADRDDIDGDAVVTFGGGLGAFWAMRFAATDHRVKAVATKSSYADKYYLMTEDSPRYKQLFAFITQSSSEEELDAIASKMTLHGYMEQIECPTLMLTGEYNHRDPLDEVYRLFDELEAPGELWVFADQFHQVNLSGSGSADEAMFEWLGDRLAGQEMTHAGEVLYIEPGTGHPDSPSAHRKRRWFHDD